MAVSRQTKTGLWIALALAAPTVLIGSLIEKPNGVQLFAVLMFGMYSIYGWGYAFADGRVREIVTELSFFSLGAALSFLGLWASPIWLAVGWFAHGAWDLLHHPVARVIRTEVPEWYTAGCSAYDWIIGAFILLWFT